MRPLILFISIQSFLSQNSWFSSVHNSSNSLHGPFLGLSILLHSIVLFIKFLHWSFILVSIILSQSYNSLVKSLKDSM